MGTLKFLKNYSGGRYSVVLHFKWRTEHNFNNNNNKFCEYIIGKL